MTIKMETAEKIMDAIAFTLCAEVCHGKEFTKMTDKEIIDYINNTTEKIFMLFCDEQGIEEVEEEKERGT